MTSGKLIFSLKLTLLIWKLGDEIIHHVDIALLEKMTA